MSRSKARANLMHRKFVKNLVSGMGVSESARKAGYIGSTYSSQLLKRDDVQKLLLQEMEKAGISDGLLAKKMKQGLNAKTVPRRDGGKRYDDQFVRKQFLDVILKIRGDYAPEKIESTTKTIQLVIDSKMIDALKDSKALPPEELQYLEHMPVREEINGPEIREEAIVKREGGDSQSIEEEERKSFKDGN